MNLHQHCCKNLKTVCLKSAENNFVCPTSTTEEFIISFMMFIWVIKSRVRWAGHVAHMEGRRHAYRV
jgi:hypothetical protein